MSAQHEHIWIKQWDRRKCVLPDCGAEQVFLFPEEGTQPDLLTSEDEVNGAVELESNSTRTEKGEETSEQSEESVGAGVGELEESQSVPQARKAGKRRAETV